MGEQGIKGQNIVVDYRASQYFYNLFWKWFPFFISLESIYFAASIRSENSF